MDQDYILFPQTRNDLKDGMRGLLERNCEVGRERFGQCAQPCRPLQTAPQGRGGLVEDKIAVPLRAQQRETFARLGRNRLRRTYRPLI